MKLISILTIVCSFSFLSTSYSQKVTFEEVAKMCENDNSEKIRITVARFSSRMHTEYNQLGSELATILTNALYEVNCFNVLESANNLEDFEKEYRLNEGGYTDSDSPEKGKMLGSQAIITGEITEYAEGKKSFSVAGLKVGSNKAHVGFILKVIHPETREVLYSKSINMDGKSNGFSGVSVFGVGLAGSENRSKAMNNAVEKAIIKAVELLSKSKDEWGKYIIEDQNLASQTSINVIVSNIDFSQLLSIESQFQSLDGIINIDKSFQSNTGNYVITFEGDSNQLAALIVGKLIPEFTISEVTNDLIKLVLK